jgi:glyoxylase-like metal-dependent hydrolase (beta-lactamase superfamily II)
LGVLCCGVETAVLKKYLFAILLIVLVASIALLLLAQPYPLPEKSEYTLDLGQVRQLATAPQMSNNDSSLPIALNVVVIAESELPRIAATAGQGFESEKRIYPSLQLVYDDYSILIDAPHDKAHHQNLFGPDAPYNEIHYQSMQKSLVAAKKILISHSHGDHIGGVAHSKSIETLLPKLWANRQQFNAMLKDGEIKDIDIRSIGFRTDSLDPINEFDYKNYKRLAPGLVAIRAAGHTEGSQMFYIRLGNGKEFLYVGDVIWSYDNIETFSSRPFLVSYMIVGEDSRAVAHQLKTLIEIQKDIQIIAAHDKSRHFELTNAGIIGSQFELAE